MKRFATCTIATALVLTTVTAPAHAATVGPKNKDGNCTVTLTKKEKEFARQTFDLSKAIGEHERARDFAAAVEKVYPGGRDLPAKLTEMYKAAMKTQKETEPTTAVTLEGIDLDSLTISTTAAPEANPAFPVDGLPDNINAQLIEAWSDTPTGMLSMSTQLFDVARNAAAQTCAKGARAEVAYPTKPEAKPNVAAIVGGVIAALLVIAGIVAALPMLGITLPWM